MDEYNLQAVSFPVGLEKILAAIDAGATTDEIRKDPMKFLVSGETIEIVINSGGEGLKLSPEIIEEMAKRGDELAKDIIEKKKFIAYSNSDKKFAYLEEFPGSYDRQNKILIEIIKEGKIKNNGGMVLEIHKVHEEGWTYEVCKDDDYWNSEYIKGWSMKIC